MQQNLYTRVITVLALLFLTSAPLLAQLQPATIRQIQSLLDEKNSRTAAQRKISSQLLQATREFRGEKMVAGIDLDTAKVEADKRGTIAVDITATVTDKLISDIKAIGGLIIYASPQYHTIRAEINLSKVETVAGYPGVVFIKPAVRAMTVGSGNNPANNLQKSNAKTPAVFNAAQGMMQGRILHRPSFAERSRRVSDAVKNYMQNRNNFMFLDSQAGTVTSQGDRAHRADEARSRYGYEGQGIKIGVLSDSYDALGGAAADVSNGNLPGPGNPLSNVTPVTVVEDYPGGSDEGRAMLQIVHDLAPKAQLFFATANVSEAGFATNIQNLRNAPNNCDIIIDDVFYYDEPVFQDGIVAQAVNSVTASGALYFSSAGNEGSVAKHTAGVWEGDFNDTGSPVFTGTGVKSGTIHNFGTAASPLNGDIITQAGNVYILTWADPQGASGNDYDLFLVSSTGVIKAASTDIQDGSQDPFEGFGAPALVAGDRLVVFKSAAAQRRAFHINTFRGTLSVATVGQIHGHSAAADAFSVAATPAETPFEPPTPPGPYPGPFVSTNQVEVFSSDGPRRIFFNADGTPVTPGNFLFATNGGNVRLKPDITAADGVATTLPSSTGLNPFYGTSASAPHAGAIAALIKSAKPSLTPAQIRTILTTTALDIESPGYDNVSGYGILQAFQAMQAVNPAPLATVTLGAVTATESTFSNNNGFIDPGELGNITVELKNLSLANASGATATIITTTPGVTVIRGVSSYGNIGPNGSVSNTIAPFTIGVNRTVACGTVINFYLTVTFNGGISPQGFVFSVTVGTQQASAISSKLGSAAPASPGYTSITGIQTGRLNRSGVASTCGILKSAILNTPAGARAFDAYTFTNQSPSGSCVTVTMKSAIGIDLFTAAYNDSGFVPSAPTLHVLGDAGSSSATQTFAVNVAAGKKFTVVVHAITPGADVDSAYTLNVSYSVCAAGPSCNAVIISNTTIANGATGTPYAQSFTASGGSGSGVYNFTLIGNLPAGLTFAGSTLHGTPTQAGTFLISVVATDPAGCPSDTNNYTLVIAGNPPASVAATYGTPQSTYPTTTFAQVLQATVKDAAGNPLPGVKVIFAAPATGASGTFAGGVLTDTVVTNNNGVAVSTAFTANGTAGTYVVTASVNGVPPASFTLTNFCPSSFVITSNADNGPGSLREALGIACPGVTISFDQSINYIELTGGNLPITRGVTIIGPGADKLTITGNNKSRVFSITAGTAIVNISGITITGGMPDASEALGGGAILVNTGTVNITGCVLANNDASLTFYGEGGAIDNEGGTVSVDRSSIINNISFADGGGITNYAGTMRITNSTITGNTAGTTGVGGGIYVNAALTLTNCTIFGNTAQYGGNILRDAGTITFRNTIIAGGRLIGTGGSSPDVYGIGYTSADFNLIENVAGATITGITTHNIRGVKPNLLPLKNYGGSTPVLLPMSNSPVINAGDSTLVNGVDQRLLARVIGTRADIGAVEVNYVYLITRGTPQAAPVNAPFAQTLQARVAESGMFVAGDSVFFAAPSSGASGTFQGSSITAVGITNTTGYATSPVFTANSIGGTYIVTARIGAQYPALNYSLTNITGGALPVVFGAMTARATNCQVQLQWKTYSEQNTRDFTIEYSRDGLTYNDLASVPARGNSTATQTYNYTHASPADGTVYYRIRQTDANGKYSEGDVMTVTNSCSSSAVVAYPNPVRDRLIIQVGGNARQLLAVHDVLGRQMIKMSINGGRYEINVKGWAKGLYTVTITQEGKITYTGKIIKD